MLRKRLYVIGNGFDLYHEIPSRYSEFGRYVKQLNSELHEVIKTYLPFEGNWSNFETNLAHLDAESILDYASAFQRSYGDEDWSDSYHHDSQYEVGRIVKALSNDLKTAVTAWASTLKIPDVSSCPVSLLPLDVGARYLNFNYTGTLRCLYRISPGLVLHIHGSVADHQPDLVLGHAINPSGRLSLNHGLDLEAQDIRVTEVNDLIDSYFPVTYKPTDEVIHKHRGYFDSLAETEEIYVVGHSLSEVDIPYFVEILKITHESDPEWIVTYYTESSVPEMKSALVGAGVPNHKVKFVEVSSLPS